MRSLQNKNILLIAPKFFGYEGEILNELEQEGANVDYLPDRPFDSSWMKAATRLHREFVLPYADSYYLRALQKFGKSHYDIVYVIIGEAISPRLLKRLRIAYPNAELVLYMWDSFRNKKSLLSGLDLYDRCITFDCNDAKKYEMEFRPLFYVRAFTASQQESFDYDISFIGTIHSDRYKIISSIRDSLPDPARAYWYPYLQAKWLYYIYKLNNPSFKKTKLSDFKFEPISKSEVQRIFVQSKAVLDIEHPEQSGATMRTFEALGAQKKLVTTNQRLRDYDFYNPDNILIIDRSGKITIPESFIESAYSPLPEDIYYKYSIKGWIEDTLRLKAR